jgi:hypothetical protein
MDNTYHWHNLFRRPHLIRKLREGPFGPSLDEFAVFLQEQHYSRITIRRSLRSADHFGRWLQEHNLQFKDAHEANRWRYCRLLGRCDAGGWPHRVKGLSLVVRFLQSKGMTEQPVEWTDRSPEEEWLERFEQYLKRVVGVEIFISVESKNVLSC